MTVKIPFLIITYDSVMFHTAVLQVTSPDVAYPWYKEGSYPLLIPPCSCQLAAMLAKKTDVRPGRT